MQWERLTGIINEAAKRLDANPEDLMVWSWPEIFGNTSGPHGGVGGQAITTFQVVAFQTNNGPNMIKWCDGVWKKWDGYTQSW